MLNQLTSFLTFIFKDMSKPILEPKTLKSVALTNSNTLQPKTPKNQNNRFSKTEEIKSVAKMNFYRVATDNDRFLGTFRLLKN